MRISDCSSDWCSSYLRAKRVDQPPPPAKGARDPVARRVRRRHRNRRATIARAHRDRAAGISPRARGDPEPPAPRTRGLSISSVRKSDRSEEHTSELQSLMRISYAVFCLKKKKATIPINHITPITHIISTTYTYKHHPNKQIQTNHQIK